MITRRQITSILNTKDCLNGEARDAIMVLITVQDKQYRELVEAVIKQYLHDKRMLPVDIQNTIQPFLPPKPSLSEKLEALRPTICQDDSIVDNKLKEYIAEAKQLENDLVLAIGYR